MMKVLYASAVGSLMYAMVCTRPDIGYAVGVVSWFMSNPRKEHWNTVKWILRFGSGKPQLDGFTDSDMSADVDTSRSTSGYVMTYAWGRCFVVVEAAEDGFTVNHGSGVHDGFGSRQGSVMDEGLYW